MRKWWQAWELTGVYSVSWFGGWGSWACVLKFYGIGGVGAVGVWDGAGGVVVVPSNFLMISW